MPTPKLEVWSIRAISPDTQEDTCPAMVTCPDGAGMSVPLTTKRFLQMMMNRMGVSHEKYGSIRDKFPHEAVGVDQINQRVAKYLEDGNVEWLIDAANYCMIEALRPSHAAAHFRATGSDESPGRVNLDGTVSHGR